MPRTNNNRKKPLAAQMLKKAARQIGAKLCLEPQWGYVGQIAFKDGTKSYFRNTSMPINSMGAAEIARDKSYANFFMKKMGYNIVPHSKVFCSDVWSKTIDCNDGIKEALAHAKRIGFPVIVKPNSGSQGKGVTLVYSEKELRSAIKAIFIKDKLAIVQKQVSGKDYRIVVLDGEIISAYERIPLNVVGDGVSSISGLIRKKMEIFKKEGREVSIRSTDHRIRQKLSKQGLSLLYVPHRYQVVILLDNANLSSGGDPVDVTHIIHPEFKKLAASLVRDMGLRLCGVDMIIKGDISEPPRLIGKKGVRYWILEINASPGLDHYARSGKAEKKIVEDLYLKVLKSVERESGYQKRSKRYQGKTK